jgi:imidazolonepropionase-like amidohydrolase
MGSVGSQTHTRRQFVSMGSALALGSLGAVALARRSTAVAAATRLAPDQPGSALAAPTTDRAALPAQAQTSGVLIRDVRIFDGRGDGLADGMSVFVQGKRIERIGPNLPAPAGALVVDGGRRVLMPGLIDNHWHTMLARIAPAQLLEADIGYVNLLASTEAEATLLRGFTTVRDLGGPSFGLKRAIDEGLVRGPRIYPCGAILTTTGGHGDFRSPSELPRQVSGSLTRGEEILAMAVTDSPDEVRVRVREQLTLGASQIKLTAGGGIASPHSPLDVATFTEDELRAAVQAAENWGTYVTVHAYTPITIQRAISVGIKMIEHGHLMDEATARLMAENDVWLSFQPFTDDGYAPPLAPANMARLQEVWTGTERAISLSKQYNIKMAWGTDILFSPTGGIRQGAELAKMGTWYRTAEVLRMATSTNAELLKLSGPRDPYPDKLGVVEEGALADLLLVNGNPLEDLRLLEEPAQNLALIMKDGQIYKNTLA